MSKLPLISKLTEKASVSQLSDHMNKVRPPPSGQSAYRPFHSTETAFLKVQSDILLNMDDQKVTLRDIPIVRQSKTDLIYRQVMRPYVMGQPFTNWIYKFTIGIIHETMVVHMPWVWTFFNNYSNHPRMCVLSTLCGNVGKHSPVDIYIYVYIYIYDVWISTKWLDYE